MPDTGVKKYNEMDQPRPDFSHLSKSELNEIKNKLARLGLEIAQAENRRPGEGSGSSLDSQLDNILADIMSKTAGHVTTEVEPLLVGEEQNKPRRVVVTGMGTVNPLGHNLEEYWNGLKKGHSGITRMSLIDPSKYPTHVAGELKDR